MIVEQKVTDDWRGQVSAWLVANGCLYMMAWGDDCSRWDDSVDYANLDDFDYGDVPDDRFVMTTWHERERLAEVFWYAEHCAWHPTIELQATVILDISAEAREAEMLSLYESAISEDAN
ncbi:hypothetical protein Q5H94_17290 [Sphingomonas sp. CA1-15]|uniref:DUF7684 domain-containing protein n=1 Tax=Sphingomonas immobilis TaxID=3063997 RepID=A0ABT9A4E3_9SPHN|nr:hypothetical protein [Sphingomonas sp. CA1-15]MDO7844085.1 hypothetical protein [Sphingomonas sp. CA1-15]